MGSKSLLQPLTQREMDIRNQSMEHDKLRLERANREHVKAILSTRKVFRKMTREEIDHVFDWVKGPQNDQHTSIGFGTRQAGR